MNVWNRKYVLTTIIVPILLLVIVAGLYMNHNAKLYNKQDTVDQTYLSFYESIKWLTMTLKQVDETNDKIDILELMYVSDTKIDVVIERFDYFNSSKNKRSNLDLSDMEYKLKLLKVKYESMMIAQIVDNNQHNSKQFNELVDQLTNLYALLPEQYSNSKQFVQSFNDAAESFNIY